MAIKFHLSHLMLAVGWLCFNLALPRILSWDESRTFANDFIANSLLVFVLNVIILSAGYLIGGCYATLRSR